MSIFWVKIPLAVLLGGVLTYLAWANAMGNILARSEPELALSIDASNEFAYDKRGSQLVTQTMIDESASALALPYVRRALQIAPGFAASLRNYALLADDGRVQGDPFAIMRLAAEFSKRDRLSLLWLIESSSRSGNIDDTLRYYDRGLSAESGLRRLLFPILGRAIADNELQDPIVELIAGRPKWSNAFISYMANDPEMVGNLSLLERKLHEQGGVITRGHRIAAARRLILNGDYLDAERMLPADIHLSGNLADFGETADENGPFGWVINATSTHSIRSQAKDRLHVAQHAGSGAELAERLILPKGRLQLRAIVSSETSDKSRMPMLTISCLGTGERFDIYAADQSKNGQFVYELDRRVPSCYFARLGIRNASNFSGREVFYTVNLITLYRGRQ